MKAVFRETCMSRKFVFLSTLVIGVVAFVVYQPALKIQFYDGWWYLIWAATMDLPRYAIQFLDPANITQGYRPVQGLYMLVLYHLFGFNPDGYHIAHTLLHAANAMLLFLIVARLGKRWQIALIAALLYAVLPVYSLAVFWHAVVDPLSAFFYLLTILLWCRFLETERAADWAIAFVAYLFALFSKEIAFFLPLILFLIERCFFGVTVQSVILRTSCPSAGMSKDRNLCKAKFLSSGAKNLVVATTRPCAPLRGTRWARQSLFVKRPALLLARRYAPFIVALVPYLILVYSVQSHGEFAGQFGFKIGPHMLGNLIPYLAVMAFPFTTELPKDTLYYVWLAAVAFAYAGVTLYKRSVALFLLGLVAVLNILPLTGFPLDYFNTRYLYLSAASSVIVIALLFQVAWQWGRSRRVWSVVLSSVVIGIVFLCSARVADSAAELAEYTRQTRVPFRDIVRMHPTFAPGTYLYFVHSPVTSVWDFEGLFFSRYRENVTVNATDKGAPANLRAAWRANAFVYYFDSAGKPMEIPVDRDAATRATPAPPFRFEIPIAIEAYEVPTAQYARGQAIVIILNWRALGAMDRNYLVFAHLLDGENKIIAEVDNEPWRGKAPTKEWGVGRLYVDALVIPVPQDAPPGGDYRLEIGWFDVKTSRRFLIENTGLDKIVIEPFSIVGEK